ncbi:type II secretion system F family protein [Pseudidiomarina sediminum]|uniref:type II secretion system F family protein n=1 Tax=Pseudidiomarina sediminum TaxID=431675 RepID=UPI001C9749DB|nr:type II secretion system F family protein [Pseudidiomarina sediminum]MBY6065072.1 type II secretion system F family protein [Pseudidiomarina sediminum]
MIEMWHVLLFVGISLLSIVWLLRLLGNGMFSEIKLAMLKDTEVSLTTFLIFLPAHKFGLLLILAALPLGVVSSLLIADLLWGLACVMAYFAGLPLLRRWLMRRRVEIIERQLPQALRLIANSLSAGMSLLPSLALIEKQTPAPLGSELRVVVQRQQAGQSLASSLQQLYQRVPSSIVQFFIFMLITSSRFGGQQAQMLSRMAAALEQQHIAKERIMSLSAQARLQSKIMFVLPIALFFVIGEVQESSKHLLLTTTIGQLLLLVAGILLAVGFLLNRRILGSFDDES